jgi:hypothetical protein
MMVEENSVAYQICKCDYDVMQRMTDIDARSIIVSS